MPPEIEVKEEGKVTAPAPTEQPVHPLDAMFKDEGGDQLHLEHPTMDAGIETPAETPQPPPVQVPPVEAPKEELPKEEPPKERRGRGSPLVGRSPSVTATLRMD